MAAAGAQKSAKKKDSEQTDVRRRLTFALLRMPVELARRADVPAKMLEQWLRLAYFQALRQSGLTVAQASEVLKVSEPTAARLSRALRTDFLGLDVEAEHVLPKRIAFMLWAGPISRARLKQRLPDIEEKALNEALTRLLQEGRVVLEEGRTPLYRLVDAEDRLVGSSWAARFGGLKSLLDNLRDVIEARFFDESDHAFARTVSFRMRPRDRGELQRFYKEKLFPFLAELEDRTGSDNAESIRLSLMWAPLKEDE